MHSSGSSNLTQNGRWGLVLWLPQETRAIWTDLNLLMLFLSVKEDETLKYGGYAKKYKRGHSTKMRGFGARKNGIQKVVFPELCEGLEQVAQHL